MALLNICNLIEVSVTKVFVSHARNALDLSFKIKFRTCTHNNEMYPGKQLNGVNSWELLEVRM